jgi:lysophospholipase L1-like esterase
VLVLTNGAALLIALFLGTEWFIARKARTTLIYQPNADFRQELAPNQSLRRDGAAYRIGPHGLRGEPPAMPKPPGTERIAVVGGSSVFDHAVSSSWPERLQVDLRHKGMDSVEVMNAGVPGFSTREVIPFFERRVRRFEPDVVLLYAGWNDAKVMRASIDKLSLSPYPPIDGGRDPYAFLRAPRPLRNWYALPLMFEKLELRFATRVVENGPSAPARASASLAPSPPTTAEGWMTTAGVAYWRSNLRRFIQAVRDARARPVLVAEATLVTADLPEIERRRVVYDYVEIDHPALVALNEAMVAVERAVAVEEHVDFIDPRASRNGRPEYFLDHVHLTEQGSAALAEALADRLPKK